MGAYLYPQNIPRRFWGIPVMTRQGLTRDCSYRYPSPVNKEKHPLYTTWRNMVRRCSSVTHPSYPDYGGRGIRVCDRWLGKDGFQNFTSDMGERPAGLTIERKDNHAGYSPENCTWATYVQQARNRRPATRRTTGDKTGLKTAYFQMRLDPEKKAAWTERAKSEGKSLSAWIESRCDATYPEQVRAEIWRKAVGKVFMAEKQDPRGARVPPVIGAPNEFQETYPVVSVTAEVTPNRPHHPRCQCGSCKKA